MRAWKGDKSSEYCCGFPFLIGRGVVAEELDASSSSSSSNEIESPSAPPLLPNPPCSVSAKDSSPDDPGSFNLVFAAASKNDLQN